MRLITKYIKSGTFIPSDEIYLFSHQTINGKYQMNIFFLNVTHVKIHNYDMIVLYMVNVQNATIIIIFWNIKIPSLSSQLLMMSDEQILIIRF